MLRCYILIKNVYNVSLLLLASNKKKFQLDWHAFTGPYLFELKGRKVKCRATKSLWEWVKLRVKTSKNLTTRMNENKYAPIRVKNDVTQSNSIEIA